MQEGHILSVLQVTPELSTGGVERTTLEIASAISRAGGLALIASAGGRLEPDLEAAGGELIKLPVHSKNPVTVIANAFKLASIIRARGVRIVHARSRAPAWSAYLAARMTGAAFVTTFHGIYNARSAPKRFYNSIMARGDAIIANSAYTKEHIVSRYAVDPKRIAAIPRGVDLDVFDPAKISTADVSAMRTSWGLGAQDARCVLIAPARLTRWKGQLVLIEAVKAVAARRPGAVKVVLAGDAQGRSGYVNELQVAIEAAQLQDVVVLAGHIAQMPTALAASDIAVFPVIEPEAFGRGAVEAQAMGLPVIASRLGGYTETVVDNETGLLTPAGSASALSAAIERLLDAGAAERRAMGERGAKRARTLYTVTALQTATLSIYQEVLRKLRDSNRREQPAGSRA